MYFNSILSLFFYLNFSLRKSTTPLVTCETTLFNTLPPSSSSSSFSSTDRRPLSAQAAASNQTSLADDSLLRAMGLDLFVPAENSLQLFGFYGELYYVRSGVAMLEALKGVAKVGADVEQVLFSFVARSPVLYEAGVTVVNDTESVLHLELLDADVHNIIHHHAPAHTLTNVVLNVSCGDTNSGVAGKSSSVDSASKRSSSASTYSVLIRMNFTFALHGRNVDETRSVIVSRLKQCPSKTGALSSVDSGGAERMKVGSVKVFLISIVSTLLVAIVVSLLVSFYHLTAIKPPNQSFKLSKGGPRSQQQQQQQRAAVLLGGGGSAAFTESVLINHLNMRSNSSSTGAGGAGGSSASRPPLHSQTAGGGGDCDHLLSMYPASAMQVTQPDSSNVPKQIQLGSNRNLFLSAGANGSPLGGGGVLPLAGTSSSSNAQLPHPAMVGSLSVKQQHPGGGGTTATAAALMDVNNTTCVSSPATSGFMPPMHTAANSTGGNSGPLCVTPTTSEPLNHSRSSAEHPLIPPEQCLKSVKRNQVALNELILQGTFGLLHNASLVQKSNNSDKAVYPVMVKTVKELSSVDHIETMLHECHVFSAVRGSDCAHVLPSLSIVMGVAEGEVEAQGQGQETDSSGKYSPPPLVLYPQTSFGILKLHLRHLRATRQSLTTRDVVGMGIQILHGLQFIVKSRLEFNDLATRNCFLDDGWVVKIGDAALARDLFPEDYQCLGDNVNRPIKWLAIEAISKYIYSPANDVWSFGITLWELWTLAETPYEDIDPFEMVSFLKEGGRLYQPPNCPDALYRCMCSCWAYDAVERPSISKLIKYLQEFYTALGAFL